MSTQSWRPQSKSRTSDQVYCAGDGEHSNGCGSDDDDDDGSGDEDELCCLVEREPPGPSVCSQAKIRGYDGQISKLTISEPKTLTCFPQRVTDIHTHT